MSGLIDALVAVLVVGVFPAAILFAVYKFWSSGRVRIRNPKLGLLNHGGEEFTAIVNEDRAALGSLFDEVIVSGGGSVPECDVLFVYARLEPDGSLRGAAEPTLRHAAARAHCSIVVSAANNESDRVVAASKSQGPKGASLVLTLDRKGDGFSQFFKELFTLMKSGKTMPTAWVKMAPQHTSLMPQPTPETIFLSEGKFVVFK
jgi:hypothetical protein